MRHVTRSSSRASRQHPTDASFDRSPYLDNAILQPLQWSELSALDALIDRSGEAEDGWTVHTLSRGLVNWPTDADRALIGLTCEVEGQPLLIGVAGVVPDPGRLHDAHLSLLIDRPFRRQGLGSLLLDTLLQLAAARGYQSASARTREADGDCLRLLMRHGFQLSSRPGPEPLLLQRLLDDINLDEGGHAAWAQARLR